MQNMEIERKFLVKELPDNLESYSSHEIEQAYLCTSPVVRIRKSDDEYYLTYKSKGLLIREEYNLPLTEDAYAHLRQKADGRILTKTRYLIPIQDGLTVELDVFHGDYEGLLLAEVEFSDPETALSFIPLDWFGDDVTEDHRYHNSVMSQKSV